MIEGLAVGKRIGTNEAGSRSAGANNKVPRKDQQVREVFRQVLIVFSYHPTLTLNGGGRGSSEGEKRLNTLAAQQLVEYLLQDNIYSS